MRIQLLDEAELGEYFLLSLASDIDSLRFFAGIHLKQFGFHRALSKRFPFGIYYLLSEELVSVYAILDLRRDPAWIRERLNG